jgi:uncharacterized protein YjdB
MKCSGRTIGVWVLGMLGVWVLGVPVYGKIWYASPGLTSSVASTRSGERWSEATNLESAIENARGGDTIWLKRGEYVFEAPGYQITKSLTLEGGYSGVGEGKEGQTRLRQLHGSRVLIIQGKPGDVIEVSVKEISLEDGDAGKQEGLVVGGLLVPVNKGGNVYIRYARATFSEVEIVNGVATAKSPQLSYGGGIYLQDGTLTLRNVRVSNNEATTKGGGIANADGVVYLEGDNLFERNTSAKGGGIALMDNSLLYRQSGMLVLSYSDIHLDGTSMAVKTFRSSLFHRASEVLLEESKITPEDEFPELHKITFSQWDPSGSSLGLIWRVGKPGCQTRTTTSTFYVPEGDTLRFQLTLNGVPLPPENLLVSVGGTRVTSRTLFTEKEEEYTYSLAVTKADSIFALPQADEVSLTIASPTSPLTLLNLTDDAGKNYDLQSTHHLPRHTGLRLTARADRPQLTSGDVQAERYPLLNESNRSAIAPVYLENGITAFDFTLSENMTVRAYVPPYTVVGDPLLRIRSLTIQRQGRNGTVENPPLLRPLVAGVDVGIVLDVVTGNSSTPAQTLGGWEVSLRERSPGGVLGFTQRTENGVTTVYLPSRNAEVEVIVSLVAFPEVRDSFIVRLLDLKVDASMRAKKGVKCPLPIVPNTAGAIAWSISPKSDKVLIIGDSIVADAVGKITAKGVYNGNVYEAGGAGAEIEIDVVDLRIKRVGTETMSALDVTDKSLELSVGQASTFEAVVEFERAGYVGTNEVEWALVSPEAGVVDYHANHNGVVLSALKPGFVTLKATLKETTQSSQIPAISSTVVIHVGSGFGAEGIEGSPLIRYHDCLTVSADIVLSTGNSLKWKSSDPNILSVYGLEGNQAVISAVGYGEATISAYLSDNETESVSKVFNSVGLVLENKGMSELKFPVKPGDVLPVPCHLLSKEINGRTDHIVWEITPSHRATITGGRLYINTVAGGGSYGDVEIKAKSYLHPEISETFVYKVVGFKMDKDTLDLNYENGAASLTGKITCIIEGEQTENMQVLWKVVDTSVVQVKAMAGKEMTVTLPLPPVRIGGETTVVVTCVENPQLQASCVVRTKPIYPVSLSIKAQSAGPYLTGETYHFEVTVEDWEVIDPSENVGWRTFDPEVIRVLPSSKGVWVQVLKPGVATLQAYILNQPEGPVLNYPMETHSPVAGIYLKESYVSMKEYATYALEYAPFPNDLPGTTAIEWSSDNQGVVDVMAYVTPDGEPRVLLMSYASGEAKITGKIKDVFGNEYTSSCVVQVLTPVESLTLEASDRVLWKGETFALKAKVYPPTASHSADIKFESLDKQVATVNQYGIVTAVKAGKAIISATVQGESKTAYCYVTVEEPSSVGIVILPSNLSLVRGQEYQLSALVNPYGDALSLSGTDIEWTSSSGSVAAVTGTGRLLAISEGIAYIRATTADGWNSQECVVRVEVAPVSVAAPEGVSLTVGESVSLTDYWQITPANATIGKRQNWGVWEVANESVAEVDEFGTVQAKTAGSTLVTATIQGYPQLKASAVVTVIQPSYDDFSLSRSALTLRKGEMSALTVRGAEGAVEWQSSNEAVVSVDASGNVVAKTVGTAVITASYRSETASCVVTVGVYAEALFITPYEPVYMNVGDRFTMTGTVIPQDAGLEPLQWTETGSSLLNLTKDGNKCTIEALRVGTSVLYAASFDGRAYRSWVIQIGDKTSTEAVEELLPPSVSYQEGSLLLQNLSGYGVVVWSLSGRTPLRIEVSSQGLSLPVALPTGVYILRGTHKDGRNYTVKLMVP